MTITEKNVSLLTCSMAADIDIFALLVASIDRHVASDIRHDVVVPKADLALFRKFETSRRRIISQEDVLPVRLLKLPRSLKHLARFKAGFHRPLYITARGHLVRGWMIQQYLKIEMTRRAEETAVMHVDSDVAFVREFQAKDAFKQDRVRFFRADGETKNPMHHDWVHTACRFLGIATPEKFRPHYVENCVLWDKDTTLAMIKKIESVHGCPIHDVIFRTKTMSEYYLYGIYVDLVADGAGLLAEDISFCKSYWPTIENDSSDISALLAREFEPKQCAIAVQSTNEMYLEDRRALYDRTETSLSRV